MDPHRRLNARLDEVIAEMASEYVAWDGLGYLGYLHIIYIYIYMDEIYNIHVHIYIYG